MAPPSFDLIYWPGLPGRGEFIRLILEDAGAEYTDHSFVSGADRVLELIDAAHLGTAASGPPAMRPPILRHGETVLTQTPNIAMYVGAHVGLAPAPALDAPDFFHVQALVQTALDGLCNETHDTHHPVATMDYYKDQLEPAAARAKDYRTTRLPKFMGYFERVVRGPASGDGPWLFGGKCTVADIVLFQCLDGNLYAFPKAMARLRATGEYDGVFALYDAVKARPAIAAYLASDRRQAYGEGIYRQYPELDDQEGDAKK